MGNRTTAAVAMLSVLGMASAGCGGHESSRNGSAKAAEAVRAADIAWEKAFSSKDIDTAVASFEADGSVLAPNVPAATGPAGVRALFQGYYSMPALTVHWKPSRVDASASGDLGYSSGAYEMSFNDATGSPVIDRGKYVTVWRRQADGSWKIVVDIFNSDLTMPGAGTGVAELR